MDLLTHCLSYMNTVTQTHEQPWLLLVFVSVCDIMLYLQTSHQVFSLLSDCVTIVYMTFHFPLSSYVN